MSAPQTSVADAPDIGIPGQFATFRSADDGRVNSALNQEASSAIPFGRFVQRGTVDKTIKLLTGSTNKLAGLLVFGHSYARDFETTDDSSTEAMALKAGFDGAVAEKGEFYVVCAGNVDPTTGVHLYHTAGTGDQLVGRCRATADTGKTLDISAFARWKTTTLSGGIAILEIDLNNAALATAD